MEGNIIILIVKHQNAWSKAHFAAVFTVHGSNWDWDLISLCVMEIIFLSNYFSSWYFDNWLPKWLQNRPCISTFVVYTYVCKVHTLEQPLRLLIWQNVQHSVLKYCSTVHLKTSFYSDHWIKKNECTSFNVSLYLLGSDWVEVKPWSEALEVIDMWIFLTISKH